LGFVVRTAALLAVEALMLVVIAALLPGLETLSFQAALLVVIAMAVINAALWPLITRLVLPLTIITFGLASLVLSAGVVALAFSAVDDRTPSFVDAIAIAFGLSLVATFVAPLLDVEGDVRNLRVVRRRARGARKRNRTDVSGVVMFEIDGLGEAVLREAVRDGHVPTIARWLSQGSHRVIGWECEPGGPAAGEQLGHARVPLV
jgi:uncharacterized membrane protein YvlD (DUF360 family)